MGLRSLMLTVVLLAGCRLVPGPYYYYAERTEGQMRAVMDWFKSNHGGDDIPFPAHHLEEHQITTLPNRAMRFGYWRVIWEGNDSLHRILARVDVDGEIFAYGIRFTISPPIDSSPDQIHDWIRIFTNHKVTQYFCWREPEDGPTETFDIQSRTDQLAWLEQMNREGTRRESLRHLISQTNKLQSAFAEYEFTKGSGSDLVKTTLRLYFQSPNNAKMEISNSKGSTTIWNEDGSITNFIQRKGQDPTFAYLDLKKLTRDQLRGIEDKVETELGIQEAQQNIGAGVTFTLKVFKEEKTNGLRARFWTTYAERRIAIFGWLVELMEGPYRSRSDTNAIILSLDDNRSITVSRSSGFITSASGGTSIVLKEITVDKPIDKKEFQPPKFKPEWNDRSESLRANMIEDWLQDKRVQIHRTVQNQIEMKKIQWDASTRKKLSRVFRTLHSKSLPILVQKSKERLMKHIDGEADYISKVLEKELAEGASKEDARKTLVKFISEQRDRLNESLRDSIVGLEGSILKPLLQPKSSTASNGILQIETETLRSVIANQVRKPIEGYFQEKMEDALRD